jgi:xanthine dehydrogenase small subunit
MRDHVRFFLNSQAQEVRGEAAFSSLTDFLRDQLVQVGTKVVCAEGDCGACTVLVGCPTGDQLCYQPADACILFLYQLDAAHVVTVEGLTPGADLHPVQRALMDHHGSQCGFCTPGFVMALAGWAEAGANPDPATTRLALTGNLCRCTGYIPILEAAADLAHAPPPRLADRGDGPALLEELRVLAAEPLHIETGSRTFFAPVSLEEAVAFKARHPRAVVVAGGTELGVLRNKKGEDPPVLLSLARIPGLDAVERSGDRLHIGANVTWTQVEPAIRDALPEFLPILERFGSPQIRNVATLVGNVAHGSPIADSLCLLLVLDADLEITGPHGVRQRSINGFYTGYKRKDLAEDELITRVTLPLPAAGDQLRLYKMSRRRDLDIATFGAGIRIRARDGVIQQAAVAFAGVAPTVVRLPRTEVWLEGRPFTEAIFRQAGGIARSEIQPISDVRGSRDHRFRLAENILAKFYAEVTGGMGRFSERIEV